jgi:hypothetical protein
MVPTEFMAAAVAMPADTLPELLCLENKLLSRHLIKVCIHRSFSLNHSADRLPFAAAGWPVVRHCNRRQRAVIPAVLLG